MRLKIFTEFRHYTIYLSFYLSLCSYADCPAKDLGDHLCVGLLDTLAFNSSSSSQEDQALISRFLLSEIESSMSPLGSYLVDQIADPDIIDIFFLGDGTKTRATISADFTSEVRNTV